MTSAKFLTLLKTIIIVKLATRLVWEDPLWDGQQCVSSTAQSCSITIKVIHYNWS